MALLALAPPHSLALPLSSLALTAQTGLTHCCVSDVLLRVCIYHLRYHTMRHARPYSKGTTYTRLLSVLYARLGCC